MRSRAGGIKSADVQDPDSVPRRDDPWPREPPKPCSVWDVDGTEVHHWARVGTRACIPGGPGKTNSQEDFTSLMNDLEGKSFDRFDDATVVHPGHGDDTTLGTERPHLAEWRKRGW
jgi:hypothetical protein